MGPTTAASPSGATSAQAELGSVQAERLAWQPWVRVAIGLLVLMALVAGVTRAGLSWDGSYILFSSLHDQQPFITHSRLTSNLLLAPIVTLSWATSNLYVLSMAFSLLMAAFLPLSLWGCWRLVRDRNPTFILWPALGITLIQLPGQFFFASEAMIATTFAWMLVSWIAVGCPGGWPLASAMATLALAIALLHPVGAVLLLAAALGMAVRGWRHPEGSTHSAAWWRVGAGLLLVAGAVRMLAIESSGYEQESRQPSVVWAMVHTSTFGWPLAFTLTALGTGAFTIVLTLATRHTQHPRWAVITPVLLGVGLAIPAVLGMVWAAHPTHWERGLDYRSPGPMIAAAFMALSLLAPPLRRTLAASKRALRVVPAAAALVCLLVITTQAVWWNRQLEMLTTHMASLPAGCHTFAETQARGTALSHWSITSLSLMLQTRHPQHVLMPRDQLWCSGLQGQNLPLAPYRDTNRQGWFRLP